MKTKRQNHHKGWIQALSVLLVFALAAGLVLGMPALSGVAYAAPVLQDEENGTGEQPAENGGEQLTGNDGQITGIDTGAADVLDWGKTCNVTVAFPKDMSGMTLEDFDALQGKGVAADLYLFAPAVRLSGYDAYAYCVDDSMPYYDLVEKYLKERPAGWTVQYPEKAPEYTRPKWATGTPTRWLVFRYTPANMNVDVKDQEGLAELMAKVLLAPQLTGLTAQQVEQVKQIRPASSGEIDAVQNGLPVGLYLNVVHGAESYLKPEDRVVLVEQTDSNDAAKVCTIAYSDTKVYTFQPQLLSLPTRNDLDTTAAGTWYYDLTVAAKGFGQDRYADLDITKTLTGYGNPVSFVFHVAAYAPDDMTTPVYEKVVPLTFTAAGSMTSNVITGKIPAGSTVVITEEYGGAGYRFNKADVSVSGNETYRGEELPTLTTTAGENSITITNIPAGTIHLTAPSGEEKILTDGTTENVVFTNDHDNTNNGGGAVVNSFTQDENGGWNWTHRIAGAQPDDAQTEEEG